MMNFSIVKIKTLSRIKFGKRINKELLLLLHFFVFSRELLNHLLEFGNSILGTVFLIRKVRLFYDISGSIAQSKQDCTPTNVEKRVGFVKQILGIPEDLLMTDKKNGSRGVAGRGLCLLTMLCVAIVIW